jgi:cyclic nucleotide-binding protein
MPANAGFSVLSEAPTNDDCKRTARWRELSGGVDDPTHDGRASPGSPSRGALRAPRGYDQPVASLAEELKRVPLFSGLSQRQLKRLARDFKEREFRPGAPMVRQGEMSGVDFFVVAEGEASVTVDGRAVGRLGPGDHFGELALIGGRVRLATVTAEGRMRCLSMRSWHFRRFVHDNPDIAWKLLQHLVEALSAELTRPRQGSEQRS